MTQAARAASNYVDSPCAVDRRTHTDRASYASPGAPHQSGMRPASQHVPRFNGINPSSSRTACASPDVLASFVPVDLYGTRSCVQVDRA